MEKNLQEIQNLVAHINTYLKEKDFQPKDFVHITYNSALVILIQSLLPIKDKASLQDLINQVNEKLKQGFLEGEQNDQKE